MYNMKTIAGHPPDSSCLLCHIMDQQERGHITLLKRHIPIVKEETLSLSIIPLKLMLHNVACKLGQKTHF